MNLKSYIKQLDLKINEEFQTFVVVAVVHSDSSKNLIRKIPCSQGTAIGGYVYDISFDCYYLDCFDYLNLGVVPFSIEMSLGDWKINLPLVESVIEDNVENSKELKELKSSLSTDCRLEYLQVVFEVG